jgi:2Fe-2S ferredoxin
MPKVTYVSPSGAVVTAEHNAEDSLMAIAVANQIEGIDGDCGGVCSCATCHVYIDPAWVEKVGPITEMELDLLEFEDNRRATSRLGCQILLTPELDGLVVRVAER